MISSSLEMASESTLTAESGDLLDSLPDELILCILSKLSATANCPADFINALITCKRLNGLGLNPFVLSRAGCGTVAVKAKNWSESAHKFIKLCADIGNVEAYYILGMIRFYCLRNRSSGLSLMERAAMGNHAPALYSQGVIQFNRSGGSRIDKDLRVEVELCARAAKIGHVDALRDGYGIENNTAKARRLLDQAHARELEYVQSASAPAVLPRSWLAWNPTRNVPCGSLLLSYFGRNVPAPEAHPANKFLSEWFSFPTRNVPGLRVRMCSYSGCGRPETRRHEFRRCAGCRAVIYCTQLDWRMRHKEMCRWPVGEEDGEKKMKLVKVILTVICILLIVLATKRILQL